MMCIVLKPKTLLKLWGIRLSRAKWHMSVEMMGLIGAGNNPGLNDCCTCRCNPGMYE